MLLSLPSLASVNFFLAVVNIIQLSRVAVYHRSQKNLPATAAQVKDDIKETVSEGVEKVKDAVKS